MSISLKTTTSAPTDYPFIPADASDRRSPCPALNALANHGYLPRRGTQITFMHLLHAVRTVYNLSLPLALLLTVVGFLTCAKLNVKLPMPTWSSSASSVKHAASSFRPFQWQFSLSWTLDLADLSARGWNKIAHDASLVHPSGVPSHAPDPALLSSFLSAASRARPQEMGMGLTLRELAAVHASRERSLPRPLRGVHEQIALGECALGWLVMRNPATGVIDLGTLEQWFGQERLPDEWWECRRPVKPVGLLLARKTAGEVQRFSK
ncbi:Chloroperoxidase [Mycena capillaripes]|nr:Chloroperoxidase [Mycena capillaripes]